MVLGLTSHWAETKFLVSIIVLSGSTPLHVVSPSLRSTVSVVAVVVQEGEVAQSTIGIATTSLDQNCAREKRKQMQIKPVLSPSMQGTALKTIPQHLFFLVCPVWYLINSDLEISLAQGQFRLNIALERAALSPMDPTMGIPGEYGKLKLRVFGKWLCRPFVPKPRESSNLSSQHICIISLRLLPNCALWLEVKAQTSGKGYNSVMYNKSKTLCRLKASCFASSSGKRALIYVNYSPLEQLWFTNNAEQLFAEAFSILIFLIPDSISQENSLKQECACAYIHTHVHTRTWRRE